LAERLCLEGAWDCERARAVPWAIAAFTLVRRAAFDAVGGFDAHQWMYAEDLSLGWRLRRAGWLTRYEPSARVRHHGGASTVHAFGEERTYRRVVATYAWMADARGRPLTAATAGIGWGAQAARAAALRPLARLAPGLVPRRDRARYWRDVHRKGWRATR
ncbi:MAG: N-acetylglucosaminyl-diphospho-decaprenol L-rhamnosyltransferase, partial [Solirubrobacteraceae bacterium]|nr:N-acetylglucosaminyl-diphospho-decaprenol L-rhamnosyltransferase [Solirubrobacteraceae bacterium]